ncbi:hypothetical protein Ddye_020513 [Dipteronia dyeriana]|uniref:Uncharacterized protein n=1 Tax=Dipteronia dyeriana TaxID=168575 RepID=A0AAD9WWM9_9ROSI|nr:hypothetical protein Ddye_020513 [Dipteronia dyeriana]
MRKYNPMRIGIMNPINQHLLYLEKSLKMENSFLLLSDEDGEVDLSKLVEKAADMEAKKKGRIQEKNMINPLLLPSCHSDNGDGWKVHENRRKRDGGDKGGEGAAVEEESGEVYVYEGLLVEEITKGTLKTKRIVEERMKIKAADIAIHSKRKKKANSIRKL